MHNRLERDLAAGLVPQVDILEWAYAKAALQAKRRGR